MAPGDELDVAPMLRFALGHDGPASLRYPKANLEKVERPVAPVELGQAEIYEWGDRRRAGRLRHAVPDLRQGGREAARRRASRSASSTPASPSRSTGRRCCKAVEELPLVVTVEEGTLEGGFGSAVLEAANAAGLDTRHIVRLGMPDRFVEHAERGELLADLGLDVNGICATVKQHLRSPTRVACGMG